MNYCENCGSKVFSGRCVNCHEELYILDQIIEQGMPLPSNKFMEKVYEQQSEVTQNNYKTKQP